MRARFSLRLLPLAAALAAGVALAQAPQPFDMSGERGAQEPSAPAPSALSLPDAAPSPTASAGWRRYLIADDRLRLAGEIGRRSFAVYLTAEQAAGARRLHVGLRNSILVAPEASRLAVRINDSEVLASAIASPDRIGETVADIPTGLLKPGINLVQFAAEQRHRTDCSVESTYALWTDVDPAATYLTFADNDAGRDAGRLTRLDDIRAIGVDGEGRTRYRLVVPALDQNGGSDVLMQLAQALALIGGMPNQSFTIAKAPERGPPGPGELTVFIGTGEELRSVLADTAQDPASLTQAAQAGIARFIDHPQGGGSALMLSGPNWQAIGAVIGNLAASTDSGATHTRQTLATQSWRGSDTPFLTGETVIDFGALGVETQGFSGRLWRNRFAVAVPADFYANAYGEARILLDAAYTSAVKPGSHIDIIVNGNVASTVPITSNGGGVLDHHPVKLTLRHFRPGINVIDVEAALVTDADAVCAPGASADPTPRFALFGSSQFVMPDFARIARVPNLAATAGTGAPYRSASEPVSLFLGRLDEETLSAAATLLGKIASSSQRLIATASTLSTARAAGNNAILVGAIADFPADVLTRLKIDPESRSSWSLVAAGGSVEPAPVTLREWRQRSGGSAFTRPFQAIGDWAKENFDLTLAALRFTPPPESPFRPGQSAHILIAQENSPAENGTWTAAIGPDTASLAQGMQVITERRNWQRVTGRITTYEGQDGQNPHVPASRYRFVPTQPLSLQNARLVAANWLSENIMSYALLIAAGGILLGLATSALLSRLGRTK